MFLLLKWRAEASGELIDEGLTRAAHNAKILNGQVMQVHTGHAVDQAAAGGLKEAREPVEGAHCIGQAKQRAIVSSKARGFNMVVIVCHNGHVALLRFHGNMSIGVGQVFAARPNTGL